MGTAPNLRIVANLVGRDHNNGGNNINALCICGNDDGNDGFAKTIFYLIDDTYVWYSILQLPLSCTHHAYAVTQVVLRMS